MPLISQSVRDTFFPKPTDRTPNCSLRLSFRTLFPMLRVRVLRVLYSLVLIFTCNYQTTIDNIVCMHSKRTNLHAACTTGSRVWTPLKDLIFALVSLSPFSCWTAGLKKIDPQWFQRLYEESGNNYRKRKLDKSCYAATWATDWAIPIYCKEGLDKWVAMARIAGVLYYIKTNIKY